MSMSRVSGPRTSRASVYCARSVVRSVCFSVADIVGSPALSPRDGIWTSSGPMAGGILTTRAGPYQTMAVCCTCDWRYRSVLKPDKIQRLARRQLGVILLSAVRCTSLPGMSYAYVLIASGTDSGAMTTTGADGLRGGVDLMRDA